MKKEKVIKISKHNIMDFYGLKRAKEDISNRYLQTINYKEKSAIYSTICLICFVIGVIGFCAIPTILKSAPIVSLILDIIFSSIFVTVAITFLIVDVLDREKILYAQRGIPYIAECYIYDKQKGTKKDSNNNIIEYYNIKVEDKEGKRIKDWFTIEKEAIDTNPVLLVFDYESKRDYDVRSKESLNIKEIKDEIL